MAGTLKVYGDIELNQLLKGLGGVTGDILYFDGTSWVRKAKGTDGQVLTLASGLPSWAAAAGGGSSDPTPGLVTAAAVRNNTTTLTDLMSTGSMEANTRYWMRIGFIIHGALSSTPDAKMGFVYPSGCTIRWGHHANNGLVTYLDPQAASGGGATTRCLLETTVHDFQVSGSYTDPYVQMWEGIVRNGGSAGALTVQVAQNTAHASDVTWEIGSTITLQKLDS